MFNKHINKNDVKKTDTSITNSFFEEVVVELNCKHISLIRFYNGYIYKYYTLDGSYVTDLKDFVVVEVKKVKNNFFINQERISCLDIDEPVQAMRPVDLQKLNFFKD